MFRSLLYDHPQGSSFVLSALPLLRLFVLSFALFGVWLYVVYVCVCVCARFTCLWVVWSVTVCVTVCFTVCVTVCVTVYFTVCVTVTKNTPAGTHAFHSEENQKAKGTEVFHSEDISQLVLVIRKHPKRRRR
jgi:hypothetical protein